MKWLLITMLIGLLLGGPVALLLWLIIIWRIDRAGPPVDL